MSFGALIVILLTIAVGIISLLIYLLPAFIAFRKDHPNKIAITLINIFLGATFIAWIICLVWALSNPAPSQVNKI